jgi:hypothetical protein
VSVSVVLRVLMLVVVLVLIAGLVFRIDRTNPPVESDIEAPLAVAPLLRSACYDCHSNQTRWPWYSQVAPASWLLGRDVSEGRAELNFSTWDRYDAKRKLKLLKESAHEIEEGEMPPWYYLPLHREARLNDTEKQGLAAWFREEAARLAR